MKKRYWIIPLLAFLVGLDWYIRAPDSAARKLSSAIESSGQRETEGISVQILGDQSEGWHRLRQHAAQF
jgi:hypothetical protein